jgi:hypothetical protein
MDGQTPQLKKLGLLPGARWSLVNAPSDFRFEIPPDAADRVEPGTAADVVVAFVRASAELDDILAAAQKWIFPNGALWIAWPRAAAGHVGDLSDNVVRDAALARSLVDTKVAAINEDWSGLKLVWRTSARGQPQSRAGVSAGQKSVPLTPRIGEHEQQPDRGCDTEE